MNTEETRTPSAVSTDEPSTMITQNERFIFAVRPAHTHPIRLASVTGTRAAVRMCVSLMADLPQTPRRTAFVEAVMRAANEMESLPKYLLDVTEIASGEMARENHAVYDPAGLTHFATKMIGKVMVTVMHSTREVTADLTVAHARFHPISDDVAQPDSFQQVVDKSRVLAIHAKMHELGYVYTPHTGDEETE